MKKNKIFFNYVLKWFILLIVCGLVTIFIIRFFHFLKIKKVDNQISKIHLTELSAIDVTGDNLPISLNYNDETLIGLDSNNNGVRDDVEVEIFKKYPDSLKIRAALLQYAMTLQMETNPSLNKDIVIKIINEQSRADSCIADTIVPRVDEESSRTLKDLEKIEEYISFVKEKQFNTDDRRIADINFYKYLDGISDENDLSNKMLNEKENNCDIDISILVN